jgi:hypothetical protein
MLTGKPQGKSHYEDQGIDGNIILKSDLREMVCDDVNWGYLVQDWMQWQAFLKIVMNIWVP